jgi:magnesium transporter
MHHKKLSKKVGKPPGVFEYTGLNTEIKTKIIVVDFATDKFSKKEISSVKELESGLDSTENGLRWIRIIGFNNQEHFKSIAEHFEIHELTIEDILNVYQRPKIEEIDGALFAEINRLILNGTKSFSSNQVSIFMKGNTLLTFQDFEDDFLKKIEARIETGKNLIREKIDFLFYSIFDLIVDEYYVVLDQINEEIEDIEDLFFKENFNGNFKLLQVQRNELRKLRQSVWPIRDIMNQIHKKEISLISNEVLIYFNDTYDHINQILEILENLRESTLSLIDVYMSYTGNRLNDIMKVLTVISTLFIPLTFIVGLYGMNFKHMPELDQWWAYPACLLLMLIIALAFIRYFRKKKWF